MDSGAAGPGWHRTGHYLSVWWAGPDRLSGPYAGMSPMYTLPGMSPAPGGIDERVFPWREPHDRRIVFSAAGYFVAAFGFHAETYLDARLGLTVGQVMLELMQPERPGIFQRPYAETAPAVAGAAAFAAQSAIIRR